jgi:hypothetical protein
MIKLIEVTQMTCGRTRLWTQWVIFENRCCPSFYHPLAIQASLSDQVEPKSNALPYFLGKLGIEFWKKLEPLENSGTYLNWKLPVFIWFVVHIDLSTYVIKITMYISLWTSLLHIDVTCLKSRAFLWHSLFCDYA